MIMILSTRVIIVENNDNKPKKTFKKHKNLFKKYKKVILIALAVVLVAGLGFGGFKFYQYSEKAKADNIMKEEIAKFDKAVREVSEVADAFVAEGRQDKALVAYNEAIKKTEDPKLIYAFNLRRAIIESNNNNYLTALAILLNIEKTNQNEDLSQYIALTYRRLNDYDNSIKYYQKAISLADKSVQDQTSYYQACINEIQALKDKK